ncbi:PREDICTED: F-box protein At5g65850-like [Camelina sativa]|uniref:F-box protein At5g65850-like n=1 Tax=Camelina sativa TaxID=90675 RepID=A0ABM0T047_CAMSA|nr:PREDICTED: F-box protein At5g65850-like [Camelina sativa]
MKKRRQRVSEDDVTISRHNARPQTSFNGEENALPIPVDLVFEMFSRLPAKYVAICRCVSKLWASALGCADFTELFFTRSLDRPQLLFAGKNRGVFSFFSSPQLQNPDVNPSTVVVTPLMHLPLDGICEMYSGPVHGLVCLINKRIINEKTETVPVICNPSTGQFLPLPKVKTERVNVISYLGYDPVGIQFKVLAMTCPNPKYGNLRRICGEHQVLTLGCGKLSWRMIDSSVPPQLIYKDFETGICINGGLYYPASVDGVLKVICFDVRSEKFTVINLDKGMVSLNLCGTLVNYKGKLGALDVSDIELRPVTGHTKCFQLWVLIDAEKHEWLKYSYVLPPLWKNVVGKAFVGVTGTNEIVLSTKYSFAPFRVFYYNLENQTVRKVEMQGMDIINNDFQSFVDHVEDVKLMEMFPT